MEWKNYYFLIVLSLILTTYSVINIYIIEPDVSNIINGVSTILSLLSLFLFIIINNEQLKEAQKSRILQFQPLPSVIELNSWIEKPNIYRDIPNETDKTGFILNFFYRIYVENRIVNIGNSPAILLDTCPKILFEIKNDIKAIEDVAINIDYLKEDKSSDVQYHSFNDKNLLFMEMIINEPGFPTVLISILYKNVLGGAFKTTQKYSISIFEEDYELLKDWYKILKNAKIDYGEKLREINYSKEISIKTQILSDINNDFVSKFKQDKIELYLFQKPGTYSIEELTELEYKKLVDKIWYGRPIGLPRKKIE